MWTSVSAVCCQICGYEKATDSSTSFWNPELWNYKIECDNKYIIEIVRNGTESSDKWGRYYIKYNGMKPVC